MLDAIFVAQKSVYWEMYIFEHDSSHAIDLVGALKKKAKEGVDVKIILDGFGSLYFPQNVADDLTAAGAEILFFNGWFRRVHRKILIIDQQEVYLGGVNVGKAYHKWTDMHIMIKNSAIAESLVRSFSHSYNLCGGQDKKLLEFRNKAIVRKTQVWLLDHFPSLGRYFLKEYYLEKMVRAKKTMVMTTPYFVPRAWLIRSLRAAASRGVKIDIIVPGDTDSKIMNIANNLFMSLVSNENITFYLTSTMNHAKTILVDDSEGMVGSANLDSQSFHFNNELGLTFRDKTMVADLKKILDEWKRGAIIFNKNKMALAWYYRPLEWIVRLISPVL
ncbi:MAG: phosphatidylserine/phosphatidylglycerophosphate/cardiolipin synthase family protein [Candidatus Paceibacterota bacterium]|jgi:cardiolipin synthase